MVGFLAGKTHEMQGEIPCNIWDHSEINLPSVRLMYIVSPKKRDKNGSMKITILDSDSTLPHLINCGCYVYIHTNLIHTHLCLSVGFGWLTCK